MTSGQTSLQQYFGRNEQAVADGKPLHDTTKRKIQALSSTCNWNVIIACLTHDIKKRKIGMKFNTLDASEESSNLG